MSEELGEPSRGVFKRKVNSQEMVRRLAEACETFVDRFDSRWRYDPDLALELASHLANTRAAF